MKQIEIYQCYVNRAHKATYTFWINDSNQLFGTIQLPAIYNIGTVNANNCKNGFKLILERE